MLVAVDKVQFYQLCINRDLLWQILFSECSNKVVYFEKDWNYLKYYSSISLFYIFDHLKSSRQMMNSRQDE